MSTTEKIITAAAIFVSLLALFVSIQQTIIMSDQRSASVWPYVQLTTSFGPNRFAVGLDNDGIGPAKIVEMHFEYQDSIFATVDHLINYVRKEENLSFPYEYSNLEDGRQVLLPGESHMIFKLEHDSTRFVRRMQELSQEVSLHIRYCSIYDECWINLNGVVTPD